MSQRLVLVVEDDPAVRRGLVDALHFAGYRVRECADGTEAREQLQAGQLDLVLLDVVLPGVDGLTLLEEIRRTRPGLPADADGRVSKRYCVPSGDRPPLISL